MANRLTKQAITTYVPAIAEVVASPAYYAVTYETRAVTRYSGGQASTAPVPTYGLVTNANGSKSFGIIGFYTPTAGVPNTTYVTVPIYTYVPAVIGVAGRDASTVTDNQLGWNSGGQSAEEIDGDFVLECVVNSSVQGVLVGISSPTAESGSFNSIEHGLLFTPSQTPSVIEGGSLIFTGSLATGDIHVRIQRLGGIVRYRVGASLDYSSSKISSGPKSMAAALYAGGDYVESPLLSPLSTISSGGEWDWGDGSSNANLSASSTWWWGGSASLNEGFSRLSVDISLSASDEEHSGASLIVDGPNISAFGFSDTNSASASMVIPFAMTAFGIDVGLGNSVSSFGMTMHAGDYDYGDSRVAIDDMGVYSLSTEDPQGYASNSEAAFFGDFYVADPIAYASIIDGLALGTDIELLLRMDLDLADHLVLLDETSIGLIISAMLENKIGIADASVRNSRDISEYVDAVTGLAGLYDFTGSTYSTNIATGAVTRYAGFDFAGFCRVGMDTYAFRKDGLYKIGGGTDSGAQIGARADFPADDFGSAQGKRVGNIFMGLATDGQVYVRTVEDGEQQMTYRAYNRRSEYRADMQRGRDSRFWRLRLEVVEGNYAELDNVEWVLTQTGRRSK